MTIKEILIEEYGKLGSAISESEKSNILFNIVKLKTKSDQVDNLYQDIKKFIDAYIESIKLADYGYDNFNYKKIEQLIECLPFNQQISILQYIISVTSREFPEHDRTWFVTRKHKSEIDQIIENRDYLLYPKTVFLFLGQSITRLIVGLGLLFLLTSVLLLPSPIEGMAIFDVTYENYSQNAFLNHLMNVLTLFADIENNFKIEPINLTGLLLLILGKTVFITFIVNFLYFKISDKISQK